MKHLPKLLIDVKRIFMNVIEIYNYDLNKEIQHNKLFIIYSCKFGLSVNSIIISYRRFGLSVNFITADL